VNHKSRKKTLIISGAAFVIILAIPFFISGISSSSSSAQNPLVKRLQHFTQRLSMSKSERIVDRREWQWKQAITMWKDYPFTGIGVGAFPIEISNYNLKTSMETPVDNAWNQYLHWLSETGIVGIVFWLWFYISFIGIVIKGIKSKGLSALNPSVISVISVLAALQFLYIFGAHLQAPEVSVAAAVFSSFLLMFFYDTNLKRSKIKKADIVVLLIVAILIFIAQGHNSLNSLSYDSIHKRYKLPYDFGFYNVERWNDQFDYKWTQKFSGQKIIIPKNKKIILLNIATIDPNTSEQNPKNITVKLNGKYLDTLEINNPDWHNYQIYTFSASTKLSELTFECDKTWQPPNETPPRQLGFALGTNIVFTNAFSRESQGLSNWHEDNSLGKIIRYRWTGKRSALNINIPSNGIFKVMLRSPVDLKFYKRPIHVTIKLNNRVLGTIELPKNKKEWHTATYTANRSFRGGKGLFTISVDKLSTMRVKNSVKRIKVGAALAIDK